MLAQRVSLEKRHLFIVCSANTLDTREWYFLTRGLTLGSSSLIAFFFGVLSDALILSLLVIKVSDLFGVFYLR